MRRAAMMLWALAALGACSGQGESRYELPADFSRGLLSLLKNRQDTALRQEIAAGMVAASYRSGGQLPAVRQLLGRQVLAASLTEDFWTIGGEPAALLVNNPDDAPLRLTVRLTCNTGSGSTSRPMTAYVEDGEQVKGYLFERTGERAVTLAPVPAGGQRLFIFTTDRTQAPESPEDKRRLGVRVALDHQPLIGRLERGSAPARRRLLRRIARSGVQGEVELLDRLVVALGLGWKNFTEGTDRAGVVLTNPGARPVTYHLRLRSLAPQGQEPVTATLRSGQWTRTVRFDRPVGQRVALPPLAAGGQGFVSISGSHATLDAGAVLRLLGVQVELLSGELNATLSGEADPALAELAADFLLRDREHGPVLLPLVPRRVHLSGMSEDRWTLNGESGAIILTNPSHRPERWELVLGCDAGVAFLPITARARLGGQTLKVEFERAGQRRLRLPAVPPYRHLLLLLDSDRTWVPTGGKDRRVLGVRVLGARLLEGGAGEAAK